jgi:hypothetical protein
MCIQSVFLFKHALEERLLNFKFLSYVVGFSDLLWPPDLLDLKFIIQANFRERLYSSFSSLGERWPKLGI